MENVINMELRKEVLEMALTIEKEITRLLILFLNIDNEDLRSLGNKSSSLTFKNKLDLLSDINVLTKNENAQFILFMEFRNQFLHNQDCNSFTFAVQLLGEDRGRRLLKLDNKKETYDVEFSYTDGFRSLNLLCIDIILEKIRLKKQQIETKREAITSIINQGQYVIDQDTNFLMHLLDFCTPDKANSRDLLDFKIELAEEISLFTKQLTENENYRDLSKKIEEVLNSGIISKILR